MAPLGDCARRGCDDPSWCDYDDGRAVAAHAKYALHLSQECRRRYCAACHDTASDPAVQQSWTVAGQCSHMAEKGCNNQPRSVVFSAACHGHFWLCPREGGRFPNRSAGCDRDAALGATVRNSCGHGASDPFICALYPRRLHSFAYRRSSAARAHQARRRVQPDVAARSPKAMRIFAPLDLSKSRVSQI